MEWVREYTREVIQNPYSVRMDENRDQKNSVFGQFSRSASLRGDSFSWIWIWAYKLIFKRADYAQKIKCSIKDFFSKCDQIRKLIFLCSVNAYDNCRTLVIKNKKIVWKHGLNWLF